MLTVNSSSPLLLLRVQITTRQLLCTGRGWGWHRKPVTVPWSHLTHRACVQNTPRGTGAFQHLSKAGSRTRAALQAATCQHSLVEEVAHIFQNLLALVLNLSYKEEGLQYYRICSKILTVLSSFLKTVLQVANASTRLCTKVRIETTTVLKLEVSVSSKTAWDSKLGHNHHQPWDTWRKSEIQSALGIQSRLVSKLFRKVSKPHRRAQI